MCVCRFIQKQGLDRTFVECDNHMWRVDNRKLPGDITVDGGSDWIVIHRNYSHYLVTDQSRFLTGLRRYYEFSLLPAEVCVCVCAYMMYVNKRVFDAYLVCVCVCVYSVMYLSKRVYYTL